MRGRGPWRPASAAVVVAVVLAVAAASGLVLVRAGSLPRNAAAAPSAADGTAIGLDARALAEARPLAMTIVGRAAPAGTPLRPAAAGPAAVPVGEGFRHQWPAVYAAARFEGEALIAAFDDDVNRYRIVFDDARAHVVDRPGRRAFRFDDLGAGTHSVRLDKISESSGVGAFAGFLVPPGGAALAPPAPRARQIEFIGDSDTVGYGNAAPGRDCVGDETFRFTDTQLSYGPQVARRFGADYQIIAKSGVGVVRNYAGADPGTAMTRLYPRVLPADPAPYDRRNWTPQIIVLALGTNDFASPVGAGERWADEAALRAEFELGLARLLADLREQNPKAFLLIAIFEGFDATYAAATRSAAAAAAEGDSRLGVIGFPRLGYRGCHWHPSRRDHERIADVLGDYLEARPALWQGR